MDLMDIIFDDNESNNDTNKEFFNRLSNYVQQNGGSVSTNKLKLCQDSQCLIIERDGEKIIFELK